MGYRDAVEDKIPYEKMNMDTIYYPPCHVCGDGVRSWNYIRGMQYTCPECKQFIQLQKLENKKITNFDKRRAKLKRAITRISKVANIENYKDIIAAIEKNIKSDNWFQSTEEVMVGLQLSKKKIQYISQFKEGPYTCDFYLPKLNVVLEVDGELYHGKDREDYQKYRDEFISNKLGAVVIRIKTKHINTNVTRITNAIYVLKKLKNNDS